MKDSLRVKVLEHYQVGSEEMNNRKVRHNGWDDVLRAYLSMLPDSWPYLSRVTDPLIRTAMTEKTARLFNNKLRGRVEPRRSENQVSAKIQNMLLDYQWDGAREGGAMIAKWAEMDLRTRLFGSAFGMPYWCVKKVDDEVLYEGNEFKVLDNRDVFVDYTATHVQDANWVQVRRFMTYEDIEYENEKTGMFSNKDLSLLKKRLDSDSDFSVSDMRENLYTSIVKQHAALEDMVGRDKSFPVIEMVTEYQADKWISFAPRYNVVGDEVETPYASKRIPIVQLRYYPTGDDVYGESEVEPVLPIARAVNAFLSGYVDATNLRSRPPIKIANNSTVVLETLDYAPSAHWLVGDSVNNVMEHQTSQGMDASFQSIYSALKAAFNSALGEFSLGVSNKQPFVGDKTATETRALEKQTYSRDEYNQMYLGEALKDMMAHWISNNKQFLFSNAQSTVLLRVLGQDMVREVQAMGMHGDDYDSQLLGRVADEILSNPDMGNDEVSVLADLAKAPNHPVVMNPHERDIEKVDIRPKATISEDGGYADVIIEPEDMDGLFDYIPEVTSMTTQASESRRAGRNKALELVLNPQVQQMLMAEGRRANISDILIRVLESEGVNDAESLFAKMDTNAGIGQTSAAQGTGGVGLPQEQLSMGQPQGMAAGIPNGPFPEPQGGGIG